MSSLMDLWGRSRPAMATFRERRKAPRYPVVENRASLSWWTGDDRVVVPARIENISILGAMLVAEGQPPHGIPLWIKLVAPSLTDWVEVTLAWESEAGKAGVVFLGTCPDDLYKALVSGCNPDASPEFGGA